METGHDTNRRGGMPVAEVLLSAIAAVSWAFIGMAGAAALGLHLLGADAAGSLGPMTAAVVAVGAGGRVTPSGDVSAFGLDGAQADTAIDVTPLGVSLVGALLLSWFFLRSLRARGVEVPAGELMARAGTVVVLFVALLGGLAWAGHDLITIDGAKLGLDGVPGAGGLPGGIEDRLPGGIGGLLPDRLGDLADAKASVGFTVQTGATLLGGAGFAAGVLLIALLASRRTPLPRALAPVHRLVRPAASALVTVVLVAVLAGLAAAAYAMAGDDHPKRIAGAALLGAPDGTWLGMSLGLFVPWDGRATGEPAKLLPDPLDDLLGVSSEQSVTLGRLAGLDGRVWLLALAMALMMLFAGVLTAARTPRAPGLGAAGFAGRCGLRLGVVTALGLPLLVWLTDVSADASLSVLGLNAFDAGIELHGKQGMALLLGAAWGAGAGVLGALLAHASGAAGRRAAPLAAAAERARGGGTPASHDVPAAATPAGPYRTSHPYRPSHADTNPYLRGYGVGAPGAAGVPGSEAPRPGVPGAGAPGSGSSGAPASGAPVSGPGGYGPGPSGQRVFWPSPPGPDTAGTYDGQPYRRAGQDPAPPDQVGRDRAPDGRDAHHQGGQDQGGYDQGAHDQETRRQEPPPRRGPRAPEPRRPGPGGGPGRAAGSPSDPTVAGPRRPGGDRGWPTPPAPPPPPPPPPPGPKGGHRRRRGDRDGE